MFCLPPPPTTTNKENKENMCFVFSCEGRYAAINSKPCSDLKVQCIFNIIQKTSEYNFVTLKSKVLTSLELQKTPSKVFFYFSNALSAPPPKKREQGTRKICVFSSGGRYAISSKSSSDFTAQCIFWHYTKS